MNCCRGLPIHNKGGNNLREYSIETDYINSKADDTFTSCQDIPQCAELPSVDPSEILGYIFVHDHDETKQSAEVKEFLEYEGKAIAEYANGGEELMN